MSNSSEQGSDRQYTVVMLGPQGAGKTVYLGSMFYKLSTPGEAGYYVRTSLSGQKTLNKIFGKMASKWPDPTDLDQTDVWQFDVMVRSSDSNNHKAATIRYFDYAGGRLTNIVDPEVDAETADLIGQADVLLGLLDGYALYREMNGDSDLRFWTEDVKALCEIMVQHPTRSIHFVISKWDLFDDSDATLASLKKLLLAFEPFANLIQSRKHDRLSAPTRLIPVSSVGYGFATPQPNGQMAIKPGVLPRPLYVEVPFACILPDLIEGETKKALAAAEQAAQEIESRPSPTLTWWEALGGWFGRSLRTVSRKIHFDDPTIDWLASRAERSARMKLTLAEELRVQNREEAARLRQEVANERSAMKFVISSMMNATDELHTAYPSSRLT